MKKAIKFLKKTALLVFIIMPATPLLFYVLWNDKKGEFGDLMKEASKDTSK
jgi:hypothetical protein